MGSGLSFSYNQGQENCSDFKDSSDQIGSTQIAHYNLSISRSLASSHQQNPFCHVGNKGRGTRNEHIDIFVGHIILPTTYVYFSREKSLKHLSEFPMLPMIPPKIQTHCLNLFLPPSLLALLNSLNRANLRYWCSPLCSVSLHPSFYLPAPLMFLLYSLAVQCPTSEISNSVSCTCIQWGGIFDWQTVVKIF